MKTRLFIIGLLTAMGLSVHSQSHYIGEILTAPDGQEGIVFYVAPNGEDYWMVALNDLPQPYKWGDLTDIPDLDNQDDSFFLHYNPCGYDATVAMKGYQHQGIITVMKHTYKYLAPDKTIFKKDYPQKN